MRYEDTLSEKELRRELRRLQDTEARFTKELKDLPKVPSLSTMILLSYGRFQPFWGIGVSLQRELPWGVIPPKTECEIGAGVWKVIRDALLAAQAIEARSAETAGLGPKDESAVRQDAPNAKSGDTHAK